MDITLRFDRGNNVYNFMVLTVNEMRRVIEYRKAHGQDYTFMYDRALLEAILGHAATFWVPEGFTAYEEGMRALARVDGRELEAPLSEMGVEFADPAPGEPAEPTGPDGADEPPPEASAMVTAVMGCHGGETIEYGWRGLAGPFDPEAITLRVKTQAHGGDMLLVIDEVLYAGVPATKTIRADVCPTWLWEPAFFFDESLDLEP